MKKLKLIIYIFSILIMLLLAYVILERNFSKNAQKGKRNMALAGKLKTGMKENYLINLMGNPDTVILNSDSIKVFHYLSNNVDYLDIEIYVDRDSNITRIILPKN